MILTLLCVYVLSRQSSLAKTVEEDNKVILYPPQVCRKVYIMDYNVATRLLTLIRCQLRVVRQITKSCLEVIVRDKQDKNW